MFKGKFKGKIAASRGKSAAQILHSETTRGQFREKPHSPAKHVLRLQSPCLSCRGVSQYSDVKARPTYYCTQDSTSKGYLHTLPAWCQEPCLFTISHFYHYHCSGTVHQHHNATSFSSSIAISPPGLMPIPIFPPVVSSFPSYLLQTTSLQHGVAAGH